MARKQTPKGKPSQSNGRGSGPTSGVSGTSRKQEARAKAAAVQAEARRRERRRNLLIQGSIVAVVAVILVGITVMVLQARDDAAARSAPPVGFNDNGGIYSGAEDAAVTVTLVEDFACPHCQAFEQENKDLLDSYAAGNDVRLEYRPIAFLDRVSTDEYSSRALNAAACVVTDNPAHWSSIHQLLYASQPTEGGPGLTDEQLVDLSVQAGADESKVATCIEDRTYDGWVKATTKSTTGESFFSGTPTVLVNGTKVEDVSAAGIQAAVEATQDK